MSLRIKYLVAPLALVFVIGSVACTQDEEAVEDAIEPQTADAPGTGDTDMPSLDGASVTANTVYFAFDDYTLNMDSRNELNALADRLKATASAVVQIEGHCDERGSIEYNLALGERRAQSVRNYLIQLGVDSNRLSTISYGEEKPAMDGHSEDAWAQNRRAEFVISAQ